jgi:hypothetical protein
MAEPATVPAWSKVPGDTWRAARAWLGHLGNRGKVGGALVTWGDWGPASAAGRAPMMTQVDGRPSVSAVGADRDAADWTPVLSRRAGSYLGGVSRERQDPNREGHTHQALLGATTGQGPARHCSPGGVVVGPHLSLARRLPTRRPRREDHASPAGQQSSAALARPRSLPRAAPRQLATAQRHRGGSRPPRAARRLRPGELLCALRGLARPGHEVSLW